MYLCAPPARGHTDGHAHECRRGSQTQFQLCSAAGVAVHASETPLIPESICQRYLSTDCARRAGRIARLAVVCES